MERSIISMCEILAFTGSKGSTGKTVVATDIAAALAQTGRTVTLLGVNRSGPAVHGTRGFFDLRDFLPGGFSEEELELACSANHDVIVTGEPFVPAAGCTTGVETLSEVIESRDYLIIDVPQAAGNKLESIARAASRVFTVVTPQQIAGTEAMSFVQAVSRHLDGKPIYLILNEAPFDEVAEIICNRIEHDFTQILQVPVIVIGFVSEALSETKGHDECFPLCAFPSDPDGKSGILRLACVIDDAHVEPPARGNVESLLRELLSKASEGRRWPSTGPTNQCSQGYLPASQDEVESFRDIILQAWDRNDKDSLDFKHLYETVRQVMDVNRTDKDQAVYFPEPRM
jgi:flagellar biosynthesis protein FlhG